jgi:hypothetical protein
MTDAPSLFEDGELAPHPSKLLQDALEAWNVAAALHGWPLARILGPTRVKGLKRAVALSGGLIGWRAALAKAGASSFLTGKTGRNGDHANWRPDLEFFCSEKKLTKILEGGFDNAAPAAARESWREKQAREARETLQKLRGK